MVGKGTGRERGREAHSAAENSLHALLLSPSLDASRHPAERQYQRVTERRPLPFKTNRHFGTGAGAGVEQLIDERAQGGLSHLLEACVPSFFLGRVCVP